MARAFATEGLVTFGESTGEGKATRNPTIHGLAASRGIHVGQVIRVSTRRDAARVKRGDVLVSEMTTPEHLEAMFRAGACVTSTGGITCHAAIVMREMGKPSVVGAGKEVLNLPEGTWIKVDGSTGVIEVLPD